MLEVEPNTVERPHDRFLAMVHPQDKPRLDQGRARTLSGEVGEPTDVRIRLPSGKEKIIQARGRATPGADGRP